MTTQASKILNTKKLLDYCEIIEKIVCCEIKRVREGS